MSTQSATRALAAGASAESLRKEAKRWLKALRAGDGAARERLERVLPAARASLRLREVQHALALEYGFAGWAALKQELADHALARQSAADRADDFLGFAVDRQRTAQAAHMLARHPEVARFSLHTAVVCGDLAEVERRLAADASACAAAAGPKHWQALQYLSYARLPLPQASDKAVAIARSLLDAGADPTATWKDDWDNPFTLLTGVIGEGEGREPPHAHATELATLLIERGADPFDTQALYNTSLHADDTFWLEFLYSHTEAAADRWRSTTAWPRQGMLDYLLGNAVSRNHIRRARWLLAHGARATASHSYSKRNLHTEAVLGGYVELAGLLIGHGASIDVREHRYGATPLGHALWAGQTAMVELLASVSRDLFSLVRTGDRERVRALLEAEPELVQQTHEGKTALFFLAAPEASAIEMAELLISCGADTAFTDADGRAAADLARMNGFEDLAEILSDQPLESGEATD